METVLPVLRDIVANNMDPTLAHNNANKSSERLPVQRDMLAGEVCKWFALNELYAPHLSQAHQQGLIHLHDTDYSPFQAGFNCMLIDLENMLSQGFKMGNAEIDVPRSFTTAAAITAQIIAQVASHIYGGNTIDRIDEVLAPYVKKSYHKHLAVGLRWLKDDKKAAVYATQQTEKEVYDGCQSMEYEINTLHTANGQTPFVTFGFGLGTSWESVLIQKSILQVRMRGLGRNQRTAIFPKLVFGLKDGLNRKPGDPNYDIKQLAIDCASKRMYPDILNYEKTLEVTGGYKAPMGCRSFLSEHVSGYAGRNNLGVVSVNLPRVALDASGSLDRFWALLDHRIDLAKQALDIRVKRLRQVRANVAPILYTEGACGIRLQPDELVFDKLFADGRASISLGYIGIHETLQVLLGDHDHPFDNSDKQALGHAIVARLRDAVEQWKSQDGLGWSLYSTPSESLCDRFCRIDKTQYGEQYPELFNKGYYTNSFHLDVQRKVSQFAKIDYETGYAQLASGGHISYVEFPSIPNQEKARIMIETVWDYTADKIPYFGNNVPISECYDCGFQGDMNCDERGFTCPHCNGNHIEVTIRVCGYLGSPDARPFNPGKQAEVIRRVKHN